MKVTLCGSMSSYDLMADIQSQLEAKGHEVKRPRLDSNERNGLWNLKSKQQAMRNHFEKIAWADGIIVVNLDKNNIANYIGGNTLIEMAIAMYLGKKLYLWNSIPEISYKDEIEAMEPYILNQDINLL